MLLMEANKPTYSRSFESLMRLKATEKRKPTDVNTVKKYELRVDAENNGINGNGLDDDEKEVA